MTSTIHEMRHTYITILKNDMPEQMLKDLVGHTVNMDTFGTYGHVYNGEMERAKSIMDQTFERVLEGVEIAAPAALPPQKGKRARGHVDTRHTDAIKAKEKRPRMPEKKGIRAAAMKKTERV